MGTLVKYNDAGNYAPYLAESWNVSKDEKTWEFRLRPNLKAENGQDIDAVSFRRNLLRLLKIYSKSYSPPTFSKIKGWKYFAEGNIESLEIRATSKNTIIFVFSERPSGFLEFLSMPYFGFYSDSDFEGENWRSDYKITSTGSYSVVKMDEFHSRLELRTNWEVLNIKAPRIVEVMFAPLNEATKNPTEPKIISAQSGLPEGMKDFTRFNSTPTLLNALVISPFVTPFQDIKLRFALRNLVRFILGEIRNRDPSFHPVQYFYDSFAKYPLQKENLEDSISALKALQTPQLDIFVQKLTDPKDQAFINQLISEIGRQTGIFLKTKTAKDLGKDWVKIAFSNKHYPLRIARVDVGGNAENWVLDMMFCSQIGISFPDPRGSICDVVKQFDDGMISEGPEFEMKIHEALERDAVVVPLSRNGFQWLFTKSISTVGLSPSMSVPRFDQLELIP